MLTQEAILKLKQDLSLPEEAIKVIQNIRSSEPVRRVQSNRKNVSGTYASKKMGVTVQFESHTLELAGIYEYEHDDDVFEYYDQPSIIQLKYEIKGKIRGHNYTPDFFVISTNWIGWEEWKTDEELISLMHDNPNRYFKDENGQWRCPPAEAYAEQYGLGFRVRSSAEINWIYQQNIRFLEDYLQNDNPNIPAEAYEAITYLVSKNPGITLESLLSLQRDYNFCADDVYSLIALREIYINLNHTRITDYNNVYIYPNYESYSAYSYLQKPRVENQILSTSQLDIRVGSRFEWDGKPWSIVNVGVSSLSAINEDEKINVEIPNESFGFFLKQGKIKGLNYRDGIRETQLYEIIKKAGTKDLEVANYRLKVIEPRLNGNFSTAISINDRTARLWVAKYKAAELQYGNGYVGLLPNHKEKGNRQQKLPSESIEIMNNVIETHYEAVRQRNKKSVYGLLVNECIERGIVKPSYQTFCAYVKKRPQYEQTKKRKGSKAAYNQEEWYWELELKTPRHGDRPFEICHMDHTELDISLVCSKTNKVLGRPWATFLVDAYTRRLLAIYITFEKPSYRSCMMTIKECVKRHSRLPKFLVVDGGKEFQSIYFETLLALYNCNKKVRPGAKAESVKYFV